jgi:hypothetical protein
MWKRQQLSSFWSWNQSTIFYVQVKIQIKRIAHADKKHISTNCELGEAVCIAVDQKSTKPPTPTEDELQ